MPDGIQDEKKWDKAKAEFKKQYKKEPKNSSDFAIVAQIYKKMGGKFTKEAFELIEQIQGLMFSEGKESGNSYVEKLKSFFEASDRLKEVKDKKGKPILGGVKVKTPNGKIGYVYQFGPDGDIRVTSKPQTGLIGWFKPNELEVIKKERYIERLVEINNANYSTEALNQKQMTAVNDLISAVDIYKNLRFVSFSLLNDADIKEFDEIVKLSKRQQDLVKIVSKKLANKNKESYKDDNINNYIEELRNMKEMFNEEDIYNLLDKEFKVKSKIKIILKHKTVKIPVTLTPIITTKSKSAIVDFYIENYSDLDKLDDFFITKKKTEIKTIEKEFLKQIEEKVLKKVLSSNKVILKHYETVYIFGKYSGLQLFKGIGLKYKGYNNGKESYIEELKNMKEKVNYKKYIKDFKVLSKTDFLKKYKNLSKKDWDALNLQYRYNLNHSKESYIEKLRNMSERYIETFKIGDRVKIKDSKYGYYVVKVNGSFLTVKRDSKDGGGERTVNANQLTKESYIEKIRELSSSQITKQLDEVSMMMFKKKYSKLSDEQRNKVNKAIGK